MKPILFNAEMVRAILDGGKTQTRRIIKGVENSYEFVDLDDKEVYEISLDRNHNETPKELHGLYATFLDTEYGEYPLIKSPYQQGDILYVRETWGTWSPTLGTMPRIYYRADEDAPDSIKWKPSIHMPKEAARIFLSVTDVKVERLQDITINDIESEGVSADCSEIALGNSARVKFINLWERTVRDLDHYGWDANPWVWVIKFERISEEEAEK